MANRVSVSIRLGGVLPGILRDELVRIIDSEGLSTDWEGEPFSIDDIRSNGPVTLLAHEVAGGSLDALEAFCIRHCLPFARTCDAYPGEWDAERLVFDGLSEPISYLITSTGHIAMTIGEIRSLGSIEAIEASVAHADMVIPPLCFIDEGADHG